MSRPIDNKTENKLISDFIGNDFFDNKLIKDCYYPNIKFKTSWDWLMPVVQKVESLGYGVTIGMGMYCVIQDDTTDTGIEFTAMEDSKLLSVYKAILQFIEWYNKNN